MRVYQILVDSGQSENAVAALEQWLSRNPDDPTVLAATGTLYVQAGRIDEAIPRYERSLKQDPKNVVALNNLAWL